jgi:hypothetical protein
MEIGNPIPHTQHRPIVLKIMAMVKPYEIKFSKSFNFKKANWNVFSKDLDNMKNSIKPTLENYNAELDIKRSSKKAWNLQTTKQ